MSVVYHYSPDLLQLLVDTIEVLCRSKRDVILFFRGTGVHGPVIDRLAEQVSRDPDSIKKREIAQQILVLVNEGGRCNVAPAPGDREACGGVGEL